MGISAVDHSVNIIAFSKNGTNYGMCVAWATQAAADKIICVLGSQSVTGKAIEKGDIVGFSCLEKSQTEIVYKLGSGHSDEIDKFSGIKIETEGSAILIDGARNKIKCKVLDLLKLEGIEDSNVIYLEYIDALENAEAAAMHMSDL